MKPVSYQLGKDSDEAYIEAYFMDDSIEISSHQFDDYDSAHSVLGSSYKMFEKLISHYRFYWQMREAQE